MALNLNLLEKVVELPSGAKRARCPACAEHGQDRKGEHLMIYPSGAFGCCVHPGSGQHRQRIFALAGERGRKEIRVKLKTIAPAANVQRGILRRLAQVFSDQAKPTRPSDTGQASDPAAEKSQDAPQAVQPEMTLRTQASKSVRYLHQDSEGVTKLRTPFSNSRGEIEQGADDVMEFKNAVLGVLRGHYDTSSKEGSENSRQIATEQAAIECSDIITQAASVFDAKSVTLIAPGAQVPPEWEEAIHTWLAAPALAAAGTGLEQRTAKEPAVSTDSVAFHLDGSVRREQPRKAAAALTQPQFVL